ncbi:MAG: ADP-ribosylglycohydrolase family protein [Planctomycetota bacterium]
MATSVRLRKLNHDYEEHVYAGLIGQAIGAGLGRHHLGDVRTLPRNELGKIGYDLSLRGDFSSAFANTAIVSALTSVRVLEDFGYSSSFSSENVAQTWLNYAVENRSVLWWGGVGHSAPHTAFKRLKKSISTPENGVLSVVGSPVAEQSGAEASATVWGLVCPGDVERAVELAAKAARVCYDGEAVFAAQAVAAMVAAAFIPNQSIDDLVQIAEDALPKESAVAKMIADLRGWNASGEVWQHTRERMIEAFGGSAFDEHHVVPHFAGVIMALLLGNGELPRSLALAASAGWGTASNLSIIGCVLGVRIGLVGIDNCLAWRAAIGDVLHLPSADAGRCVTDVATEALALARMGREIQRSLVAPPKKGARFHFELPGSTHGFSAETSHDSLGLVIVSNIAGHSRAGKRSLSINYSGIEPNRAARISAAVFPKREKQASGRGAYFSGSPLLYPGQTIRMFVEASGENKDQVGVRPFIRYFGEFDELTILRGPEKWLLPEARYEFQWTLPHAVDAYYPAGTQLLRDGYSKEAQHSVLLGRPIGEIGVKVFSDKPASGIVHVDYITWDGAPRVDLGPPDGPGLAWQHAWVNAATQCEFGKGASALRVSQTDGTGLLIQGTRSWRGYSAVANVTPRMARSAGIAICVQGQQRYYALLLCADKKVRLIKQLYGTTVLAEADFAWSFGQTIELSLAQDGKKITANANGRELFKLDDTTSPLEGGAFALVVEEGCLESSAVRISPVE